MIYIIIIKDKNTFYTYKTPNILKWVNGKAKK